MTTSLLSFLHGYWAIGIFAGMFGIGALFMVFIVFKDRWSAGDDAKTRTSTHELKAVSG